jgi:methylenetetrahydrofolate dehydrogenase (NADP+)/methenyltetrahydrofolate cyclohydrolase
MTAIIDGKLVASQIRAQVKHDVAEFIKKTGIVPGLATVLVGHDPASQVYIRNKVKMTAEAGMKSFHFDLPETVSEAELLKLIDDLNADPKVHGILVQLPIPLHIHTRKVLDRIRSDKDVDGFHPENVGQLAAGVPRLRPCTPYGVMKLLEYYKINPQGKHALVIGRSKVVGRPMSLMLLRAHATVTTAHRHTPDLKPHLALADIVVVAVGKAKFIHGDWIKPGAVVIDVGINRMPDGKICGDVDFDTAVKRASYISPVPGGVGPMTIAMLLVNTLEAARGLTKVE